MLLSDAERQRFIEYLEQSIASSKALLTQLEKLGNELLTKRERFLIAAETVVLAKLRDAEIQTLGQ